MIYECNATANTIQIIRKVIYTMSKKSKRGLSSNAKWAIALLVEVIVIVLMVAGYFTFWWGSKYNQIKVENLNADDLSINEGANEAQKGFKTIALFGIDARDSSSMGEGNRTDTIIIASINNDTKEVKLVSVYRDSFLEIADGSGLTTKVNAAYSYGGPALAIKTLNANLDLEITEFITVNFLALSMAIDDLGGINIDVEDAELPMLNACISEQINITGIYSDGVFTTGNLLLNGTQATAYARIRSTDQGDITRTERQRDVLSKMIVKAKSSDMSTINKIIDDVFPNIYTSITKDEMMSLAKSLFSYELGETVGFPFAFQPVDDDVNGSVLVPANLASNVTSLHEFLFGSTGYVPTQSVQNISNKIQSEMGVGAQDINIETFTAQ